MCNYTLKFHTSITKNRKSMLLWKTVEIVLHYVIWENDTELGKMEVLNDHNHPTIEH